MSCHNLDFNSYEPSIDWSQANKKQRNLAANLAETVSAAKFLSKKTD